eukprot:GHRQ01009782.1.p4 GENE.GHRQ01009782.1~~GHRQ01009782.1.p4  ORF type:complete len:134 (+),score=29.44 GHRQ01009782.1:472-873(+)
MSAAACSDAPAGRPLQPAAVASTVHTADNTTMPTAATPAAVSYLMAHGQDTRCVALRAAVLANLDCHLVRHGVGVGEDAPAGQGRDDKARGCALGLLAHLPGAGEVGAAGEQGRHSRLGMGDKTINDRRSIPW